jgi:protein-S-isoprenylcysteine O-methyltransferase Ste14
MAKGLGLIYGVAAYAICLAALLYAIGFVEDLPLPTTLDKGQAAPALTAAAIDLLLLGLFAIQHSVMARPAFKRGWTRIVPQPIERSTYVLAASLVLALLCWQWRPIPAVVWSVGGAAAVILRAVSWVGWAVVLGSTFLLNHFELFGLSQVWGNLKGKAADSPVFRTPLFYGFVRHPLYLGFVLAFWAAPTMTLGHLLFAAATLGYILIAIQFEERDLIGIFGETYVAYRRRVSMLIPLPPRKDA